MCNAEAIQCEEAVLAAKATESNACTPTIRHNTPCSSECAALANQFSSGPRCLERVYSNELVLAHVVNETCSDSSEHYTSTFLKHGVCFGLKNIVYVCELIEDAFLECNSQSGDMVKYLSSRRSEFQQASFALNTHCNLSSPFPSDLPDEKALFDNAAHLNIAQPAGHKLFIHLLRARTWR